MRMLDERRSGHHFEEACGGDVRLEVHVAMTARATTRPRENVAIVHVHDHDACAVEAMMLEELFRGALQRRIHSQFGPLTAWKHRGRQRAIDGHARQVEPREGRSQRLWQRLFGNGRRRSHRFV